MELGEGDAKRVTELLLPASDPDTAYLRRWAAELSVADLMKSPSMRDTTPEFQRQVDERHRRMSPAERVRICTEMFDTARLLVEASLPQGLEPIERRRRIGGRFQGELARRAFAGL